MKNGYALRTSLTICIAFCADVVLLARVFSSKMERNRGNRKSTGNLDEKRCKGHYIRGKVKKRKLAEKSWNSKRQI